MLQILSSKLDDSGLDFWPVACKFHDLQLKTYNVTSSNSCLLRSFCLLVIPSRTCFDALFFFCLLDQLLTPPKFGFASQF